MKTMIECRNEEFLRRCAAIFEREYKSGKVLPIDKIIDQVLAMQPRSHYLTYDTAARRLHKIHRLGIENVVKEDIARDMWRELQTQIDEYLAQYPKRSFHKALSFVLNYRRPSRFYISRDSARRIIAPNIVQCLFI
ncbi:MAG: hypothetical protein J1F05_01660 [Muribaculaceae bacterium]|nr:hypothetical protein [Muribaculaceae bacterium]